MVRNKRIGILGGSFDPVHQGHMRLARAAQKELKLDRVIFLPAKIPPHKERLQASGRDRVQMLRRAIARTRCFSVSSYELGKNGVTYSRQPISYFIRRFAQSRIYFIIGGDSLRDLHTWKGGYRLLDACQFIIGKRPGVKIPRGIQPYMNRIAILKTTMPLISSADIKQRIKLGKPVSSMISPSVERYINDHGLYRMNINEQKIIAYLKKHLSRPRFLHSLGTMRMAELLARSHGADAAKARLAGLLHDCSRGLDIAAMRAYARGYDPRITHDNVVRKNPALLHGWASAGIAKKYFKVRSPDVLQAIARHTIACPRMSQLDNIIYLADMAAPDRRYRESSALRQLARRDLIAAMKKALAIKIRFVLRQKHMIHPFAVLAWNELYDV